MASTVVSGDGVNCCYSTPLYDWTPQMHGVRKCLRKTLTVAWYHRPQSSSADACQHFAARRVRIALARPVDAGLRLHLVVASPQPTQPPTIVRCVRYGNLLTHIRHRQTNTCTHKAAQTDTIRQYNGTNDDQKVSSVAHTEFHTHRLGCNVCLCVSSPVCASFPSAHTYIHTSRRRPGTHRRRCVLLFACV